MKGKDIDNLEKILLDLEDVENGAMISLSQEEIESLESILETLKDSISKDIKEKVEKEMISNPYDFSYMINKLLEENNNE